MPRYTLPPDLTVDSLLLSADGSVCRCLVGDGRTTHLFVDGVALASWQTRRGHARQLASSPDLEEHAWVSRGEAAAEVVTSGGDHFGPYAEIWLPSDAFDGGRLKFVAQGGGKSFVHLGDERHGPFAAVGGLGVLDERGTIGFAFRRGRSWFAWIDGDETGPYEGLVFGLQRKKRGPPWIRRLVDGRPVVLGGAGKHLALHVGGETEVLRYSKATVEVSGSTVLLACGQEPTIVRRDGEVLAEVDRVRSIRGALGPGEKRVGFAFDKASFAGFYLDGERCEGFGYTDGPWWSADGAQVAWGQGDDEPAFVVDGERHVQPHRIDWESADDFGFGPDGRFHALLLDEASGAAIISAGNERCGPLQRLLSSRSRGKKILTTADGQLGFAHRGDGDEVVLRARGRDHRLAAAGSGFDWIVNPLDRAVAAFVDRESRELRVEEIA